MGAAPTADWEVIRAALDAEEAELRAWIAQPHTSATTIEGARLEREIFREGRNAGPDLLDDAFLCGEIYEDELRDLITGVWSAAEWPEPHLGRERWVELFRAARVFPKSPPPSLTVYRGAVSRRRLGMAWTTDLDMAHWFAGRCVVPFGAAAAYVYRTVLDRSAILCDVDAIEGEGGRLEGEIVVDPRFIQKVERIQKIAAGNAEAAMAPVVAAMTAEMTRRGVFRTSV